MLALTQSKADIRAYHRIVECYGKYITAKCKMHILITLWLHHTQIAIVILTYNLNHHTTFYPFLCASLSINSS